MQIKLDGEEVTEAIINYINQELDTDVKAIDYPSIQIGKNNYELNLEADISLWVVKEKTWVIKPTPEWPYP